MFVFRLAKELGKTVKELASDLGEGELDYWRAYYGIEPFGERQSDLRAGIIASTVANVGCVESEFTASDFMIPEASLERDAAGEEPDCDELCRQLLKWAATVAADPTIEG